VENCSNWLCILDAFRTIDWRKIKEELEIFKFTMRQTINLFIKIKLTTLKLL